MIELWEIARAALAGALIVAGLALIAGGLLGVLRFPDLYTRLHGALTADGLGAPLAILGLAIIAPDGATAVRLLMLAALTAALAPTLAHFVGAAAHGGGLSPIVGRHATPRPGAKSASS